MVPEPRSLSHVTAVWDPVVYATKIKCQEIARMGYPVTSLMRELQALVRARLGEAFTCHCEEGPVLRHLGGGWRTRVQRCSRAWARQWR